MLKNKKKIIMVIFMIILMISTTFVLADNEDSGVMPISENPQETTTSNQETTTQIPSDYRKSDVFLTGDKVTVDYIVDGNLFIFANEVIINSQIGGDAFVFANKVTIGSEGYIYNNLFTAASSVTVQGVVYDLYSTSSNLTIAGGFVYRDLKSVAKDIIIQGGVGRNALLGCVNLSFADDLGNATGVISGDLNYYASNELSIPEGSVRGNTSYTKINTNTVHSYLLSLGSFLALVLIVWLLCCGFASKFLETTNEMIAHKKVSILVSGLVGLIAIPAIVVLLLFIQITANVALLLLLLYGILISISTGIFAIATNNFLCHKLKITKNIGNFGMLIITSIVIWGIGYIPYIGTFLSLVMIVLGLGFILSYLLNKNFSKEKSKIENDKKEIKEDNK